MVLTNISKIEEMKVHSPIAGGSSSPSGPVSQSRKRLVERAATRVPRKLSRVEGISVPGNLDPRLMTLGVYLLIGSQVDSAFLLDLDTYGS